MSGEHLKAICVALADEIAAEIESGFEIALTEAISDADKSALTGDDRTRSIAMSCFFAGWSTFPRVKDALIGAAKKAEEAESASPGD